VRVSTSVRALGEGGVGGTSLPIAMRTPPPTFPRGFAAAYISAHPRAGVA